jgi:hypothetical protein
VRDPTPAAGAEQAPRTPRIRHLACPGSLADAFGLAISPGVARADRKFENTKEHNVIFYDMGASSLKTSFVTFSAYDVLDGKKNKTVGA